MKDETRKASWRMLCREFSHAELRVFAGAIGVAIIISLGFSILTARDGSAIYKATLKMSLNINASAVSSSRILKTSVLETGPANELKRNGYGLLLVPGILSVKCTVVRFHPSSINDAVPTIIWIEPFPSHLPRLLDVC